MSKQRDRDEFIAAMAGEGVPVDALRKVLRYGATLHRIAELQCSSEAADRDQVPCPQEFRHNKGAECLCRDYGSFTAAAEGGGGIHGTVPRVNVQEARTEARVLALLAPFNVVPVFNGDPRGAVLKLKVPSGRTNDWGRDGVCVP